MDDFNFYRFIAYLIGFAIAAMLLVKLYLIYAFRKLEKEERQRQQEEQPK
jgi:large-conductance mechanosensitive channel